MVRHGSRFPMPSSHGRHGAVRRQATAAGSISGSNDRSRNSRVFPRLLASVAVGVALVAACGTCYVVGSATRAAPAPAENAGMDAMTRVTSQPRLRRELPLLAGAALLSAGAPSAIAKGGPLTLVKGTEAKVTLTDGLEFPRASFGLQIYDDGIASKLTDTALSVGYRNFFASVLAGNQRGFAKAVKASGVPREEIFICGSVVSNRAKGFDDAYQLTKKGCDENLRDFGAGGITYVDMIMLDYPGPNCDAIRGQWKAFEQMLAAGKTKSLAVSNFSPEQLDCLLSTPGGATVPTVNQLPMFVGSGFDARLIEQNAQRGTLVQAWSPLGGGGMQRKIRNVCGQIGQKYYKSFAQVALRWIVQQGATFSTQTKQKDHFIEDLDIFDFQLSNEDMATLSAL